MELQELYFKIFGDLKLALSNGRIDIATKYVDRVYETLKKDLFVDYHTTE